MWAALRLGSEWVKTWEVMWVSWWVVQMVRLMALGWVEELGPVVEWASRVPGWELQALGLRSDMRWTVWAFRWGNLFRH